MNVALTMAAVKLGATVANYCGVTELHKNAQGKLVGVRVNDGLTGREFNVRVKVRPLFSSQRLVSHIQTGHHQRDRPLHSSLIPRIHRPTFRAFTS